MATNIKLLLDTRRAHRDRSYPLVMRVIRDRKNIKISLGYSLLEKDWDSKNEKVKKSTNVVAKTTRFNNLIHKKRANAYDIIARLDDEKKLNLLSMIELKMLLTGNKVTVKPTLFAFLKAHISELRKARKTGNAGVYA